MSPPTGPHGPRRRRRKWARKGAKSAAEEAAEGAAEGALGCCCLSEVFGVVAVMGAAATVGVRRRRRR